MTCACCASRRTGRWPRPSPCTGRRDTARCRRSTTSRTPTTGSRRNCEGTVHGRRRAELCRRDRPRDRRCSTRSMSGHGADLEATVVCRPAARRPARGAASAPAAGLRPGRGRDRRPTEIFAGALGLGCGRKLAPAVRRPGGPARSERSASPPGRPPRWPPGLPGDPAQAAGPGRGRGRAGRAGRGPLGGLDPAGPTGPGGSATGPARPGRIARLARLRRRGYGRRGYRRGAP